MLAEAKAESGTGPRYRVIAEELLSAIRGGKLAVGTRMPGELELMKTYGVSRHTIREALRVLEDVKLEVDVHDGALELKRASYRDENGYFNATAAKWKLSTQ